MRYFAGFADDHAGGLAPLTPQSFFGKMNAGARVA